MDLNATKHAFKAGSSYVQQNLDAKHFSFLKEYFDVNNAFIYDKIKLIVWPFNNIFDFLYKPDLYIPIMSMITLVLFKSTNHGFNHTFDPEKLFFMFSRNCAALIGLPILYMIFAFILAAKISYMPLICFSGYKYVVILFIRVLFNFFYKIVAYFLSIYLLVAYFLFFTRSIKTHIQKKSNEFDLKLNFVFGLAIIEILLIIVMQRE
ncbi:hypothetical protein NUSPORA_01271 [Nucleospora cyclopteri]